MSWTAPWPSPALTCAAAAVARGGACGRGALQDGATSRSRSAGASPARPASAASLTTPTVTVTPPPRSPAPPHTLTRHAHHSTRARSMNFRMLKKWRGFFILEQGLFIILSYLKERALYSAGRRQRTPRGYSGTKPGQTDDDRWSPTPCY
ncbi:hypothetical protein RR46_08857 [Papilio xuthus]|uniref:Uncharacterized protein n=1 Tax=Papilio xuthus TaxID=66420 RepID=A0A194PR12_PAPXU|nr:hypothetical protein RR46_08857 [Papilio xuthus]